MCGRFTQRYIWSEVHAFLSVIGAAKNLRPRYNIALITTIDVVRLAESGRELVSVRWASSWSVGRSRYRTYSLLPTPGQNLKNT